MVAAGLAGLAVAVAARVRIAGAAGAASVPAGVTFGVLLVVLAAALGLVLPRPTLRQLALGVAGAAVLCLPVALHRIGHPGVIADQGKLPVWAAGVTFVAVAEEALLRGALYDRLRRLRHGLLGGPAVAIGVTAVAFALLHAPVYGWRVVPLDLAVGVWLGVARHVTGSVTAPAIIHTLADLAGWWLR
jgi:membrane protease YdiL (CAAX protease family)